MFTLVHIPRFQLSRAPNEQNRHGLLIDLFYLSLCLRYDSTDFFLWCFMPSLELLSTFSNFLPYRFGNTSIAFDFHFGSYPISILIRFVIFIFISPSYFLAFNSLAYICSRANLKNTKMNSFKKIGFFSALILPFLLALGFYLGGIFIFLIHIFVFLLVPLMDYLVSNDKANVSDSSLNATTHDYFYRFITFLWVYIQFGVLIWTFYAVSTQSLIWWEWLAFLSGTALVTGGIGITVAHELGHKAEKIEQLYSKVLLMMVCYMHFFIEHNRGHHVHVATPQDPATSRFGESFYRFWFRSVVDGYRSATRLEADRLRKKSLPIWSLHNQMIQFAIYPLIFVGVAFGCFSIGLGRIVWEVPLFFFAQSILGFSLLEIVNYLEHYGMERRQLPNGKYEKVAPIHSWNASHIVSNFLLFQLQRHSDHHTYAFKRYQVLNHNEESPQLPAGYSAMIMVALFPPLWYSLMNPRLEKWKSKMSV